MFANLEDQVVFRSARRHKFHNRKYMCSNLIILLFYTYVRWVLRARDYIDMRTSTTFFSGLISTPRNRPAMGSSMGIGTSDRPFGVTFSDRSTARRWVIPLRLVWTHRNEVVEIFKHQSECPVDWTNRRVLDPSENVTPNTRFELPMGSGSTDRRIEIPTGGQLGEFPLVEFNRVPYTTLKWGKMKMFNRKTQENKCQ